MVMLVPDGDRVAPGETTKAAGDAADAAQSLAAGQRQGLIGTTAHIQMRHGWIGAAKEYERAV